MRGDIKAVSTAARTVRQQVEERREEFSSSSRQTKMRESERARVNVQMVHHLHKNQDNSGSCGAMSFRCNCKISHNGSKERKKSLLIFD